MGKRGKEELLMKLAEIAKDPQGERKIAEAADRLFPRLETLLPDYDVESEVENMAITYGHLNRQSGFVDGFNTAVLLLAGSPSLLLDAV